MRSKTLMRSSKISCSLHLFTMYSLIKFSIVSWTLMHFHQLMSSLQPLVHCHQQSCILINSDALTSISIRSCHVLSTLINSQALSSTLKLSRQLSSSFINSRTLKSTLKRSRQFSYAQVNSQALSSTLVRLSQLSSALVNSQALSSTLKRSI